MNIALLILGVLVILFSTILIIINTIDSENKKINPEAGDKVSEQVYEYTENIPKKKGIINEVTGVEKESIEMEEKTDIEDDILYQDFSKTNLEIYDNSQKTLSTTDEIIKMYKKDGLTINEIAKKLKKGIREIEIILKVNKIED